MNDREYRTAIAQEPGDAELRLAYAQWLEQRGDSRGELLRIQEQLRQGGVADRRALETRMHQLLKDGVSPLTITYINQLGSEFVLIFPGTYLMGRPARDRDRWDWEFGRQDQVAQVVSEPFYLGRFAVTQEEWFHWMQSRPWEDDLEVEEDARLPAVCMTHEDATEYCEYLTEFLPRDETLSEWVYRLPTEVQWEYACRAGTSTPFSFDEDSGALNGVAWSLERGVSSRLEGPQPVGRKRPNPWGLYDMHGNVWEWCRDWFEDVAPMLRGGAWTSYPEYCRSNVRNGVSPQVRCDAYGFRVALVPPASRNAVR